MQLPDYVEETDHLINAHRVELHYIEVKLESAKINPGSPKWRRLVSRKAELFEYIRDLTTHRKTLVGLGRFISTPSETLREIVPIAH
ncbi:hypothetical protein IH981_00555 [Patescibacteria group bacterium]|nr:hypothetical protein [Patescibacteria group bacterium]